MPEERPSPTVEPLLLCADCRKLCTGRHCRDCGAKLIASEQLRAPNLLDLIYALGRLVQEQIDGHAHDGPTPEELEGASRQPRGDWGDRTCRTCERVKAAAFDLLREMTKSVPT